MNNSPYKHTEKELCEFGSKWNIRLPKAYRNYLLEVGGTCLITSKVNLLEDWDYQPESLPWDHLCSDFPHKSLWNEKQLFKIELGYKSEYYSRKYRKGSIPIKETGCEGKDILIISGSERGKVWHDDRACNGKGIFPLLDEDGNHMTIEKYLTQKNT